ncbi:hypothetical protein TELCIR_19427, partial [Teladorsagia circumcincta]
ARNETTLGRAINVIPSSMCKDIPIYKSQNLSSSCVVRRLEGVLNAYHKCVPVVRLYGPTNFAPVITEAARRAAEVRDGSHYQ